MIRQALFSMFWGMLGALTVFSALQVLMPPLRFAQIDLVAIMQEQTRALARHRTNGGAGDATQRAQRIQAAVQAVCDDRRRLVIASQALVAVPAGTPSDIPDLTDAVRRRLQ